MDDQWWYFWCQKCRDVFLTLTSQFACLQMVYPHIEKGCLQRQKNNHAFFPLTSQFPLNPHTRYQSFVVPFVSKLFWHNAWITFHIIAPLITLIPIPLVPFISKLFATLLVIPYQIRKTHACLYTYSEQIEEKHLDTRINNNVARDMLWKNLSNNSLSNKKKNLTYTMKLLFVVYIYSRS